MPIEIKELHIKINVDEGATTGAKQSSSASKEVQDGIIAACVEEIMGILGQQQER